MHPDIFLLLHPDTEEERQELKQLAKENEDCTWYEEQDELSTQEDLQIDDTGIKLIEPRLY